MEAEISWIIFEYRNINSYLREPKGIKTERKTRVALLSLGTIFFKNKYWDKHAIQTRIINNIFWPKTLSLNKLNHNPKRFQGWTVPGSEKKRLVPYFMSGRQPFDLLGMEFSWNNTMTSSSTNKLWPKNKPENPTKIIDKIVNEIIIRSI